jgi:hypothetical protein
MTTARSEIVDVELTPYYHCITRCVRRAFLCGQDEYSGRDFDHRKTWVVDRIKLLASLFAIDVCAYAVMSSHLHLVLRVMPARVEGWSDDEVLDRVGRLCPTCVAGLERWRAGRRRQLVETWRARLSSLSWFMAKLDEHIARRANEEDRCRGRFWEGRFTSKALMDHGALLTCMAYVDLNPVRAGIAAGLEDSSWTSIQQRLREAAELTTEQGTAAQNAAEPSGSEEPRPDGATRGSAPDLRQCPALAPMADDRRGGSDPLPLSLIQYVALLEWTGRAMRRDKVGFITAPPPELVAANGLDPDRWLDGIEGFGSLRGTYVGHPSRLRQRAGQVGRRWLTGQGTSIVRYAMAA